MFFMPTVRETPHRPPSTPPPSPAPPLGGTHGPNDRAIQQADTIDILRCARWHIVRFQKKITSDFGRTRYYTTMVHVCVWRSSSPLKLTNYTFTAENKTHSYDEACRFFTVFYAALMCRAWRNAPAWRGNRWYRGEWGDNRGPALYSRHVWRHWQGRRRVGTLSGRRATQMWRPLCSPTAS